MGAGGDASDIAPRTFRKTRMGKVKEDLTCLKSMWFDKVSFFSCSKPYFIAILIRSQNAAWAIKVF